MARSNNRRSRMVAGHHTLDPHRHLALPHRPAPRRRPPKPSMERHTRAPSQHTALHPLGTRRDDGFIDDVPGIHHANDPLQRSPPMDMGTTSMDAHLHPHPHHHNRARHMDQPTGRAPFTQHNPHTPNLQIMWLPPPRPNKQPLPRMWNTTKPVGQASSLSDSSTGFQPVRLASSPLQ